MVVSAAPPTIISSPSRVANRIGTAEPVNGSTDGLAAGGLTTLTPSTAMTGVLTWLDGCGSTTSDPATATLSMTSAGRPVSGSNVGVSIVTWKVSSPTVWPTAKVPTAQCTVFWPASKLAMPAGNAEPST